MVLPPSGIRACSSEVAGAYFWYLELVLPPFQVCSSEIVGAWICSALVGAASLLGPGLQFRRRLFFLQLWLALPPFWVRVCSSESVGPCLYFFGSLSWWVGTAFLLDFQLGTKLAHEKMGPQIGHYEKIGRFCFEIVFAKKKLVCKKTNAWVLPHAKALPCHQRSWAVFFLQWIFPSVAFCQLSYQTHHHQIVFG